MSNNDKIKTSPRRRPQKRQDEGRRPGICLAAYTAFLFVLQVALIANSGLLNLPPERGDGPDYDNIAVSLWRGHGYSYFYSNEEWKEPYRKHNTKGYYNGVIEAESPPIITAFRPPALPLALSTTYKFFGRHFGVWRIINTALITIAISLGCAIAFRIGSWPAASIVAVLGVIDFPLNSYGALFFSEGISVLLLTTTLFILLKKHFRGFLVESLEIGVLMGLLLYTRTIFQIFIPILLLALFWRVYKVFDKKKAINHVLVCTLAVVVTILPWCVRNVRDLNAFYPLGTQGPIGLGVAYSDGIYKSKGLWTRKAHGEIEQTYLSQRTTTGVEVEKGLAKYSSDRAKDWIRKNPEKLPKLFYLKAKSLIWDHSLALQKWLLLFSLLSTMVLWRDGRVLVLAGVVVTNVIAVGLSWNYIEGRFWIPFHPLLHVMTAVLLGAVLKRALAKPERRQSS